MLFFCCCVSVVFLHTYSHASTIPRYLNTEYCELRSAHSTTTTITCVKRPNVYTWHTKCILFLPLYRLCRRARERSSAIGVLSISLFVVYSFSFDWNSTKQVIVRYSTHSSVNNIVTSNSTKHTHNGIICIAVIKCLFYYYFRSLYLWVLTKMCNVQFAVCTVCITSLHQHRRASAISSVWNECKNMKETREKKKEK